MPDQRELDIYLRVARKSATESGVLLKAHLSEARTISFKGEIDLVTEMDQLSEKIIVETIHSTFPEHGVLAEESTQIRTQSDYLWVIDPLDGTTNYAHGYPNFAVSIGLVHSDGVILGVVYDPMREELFSAVRGCGAFLNDRRLWVSECDLLIRSLLATGFPYDRMTSDENNINYFNAMLMASQEVRRSGSAALDLCSVAAGRLDGYWELKLKPWDVAAGSLIVNEAGGRVSDMTGRHFSLGDPVIVASNGRIHEQMLAVLERAK
jgi:myo-inositol-1(or 4)-monophosphatase